MPDKRKPLPRRRPAETGTAVAGAVVAILIHFFPSLKDVAAPLIVVVAAAPAGITWVVERYKEYVAGE